MIREKKNQFNSSSFKQRKSPNVAYFISCFFRIQTSSCPIQMTIMLSSASNYYILCTRVLSENSFFSSQTTKNSDAGKMIALFNTQKTVFCPSYTCGLKC